MQIKPLRLLTLFGFAGFVLAGCAGSKIEAPELVVNSTVTDNGEPSHITVQHILIGFQGSLRGKNVTRSREEAQQLALELLGRARSGEDFATLVEQYSDDSPPGIYHMANFGQPSDTSTQDPSKDVNPRQGMVPAFGNTGFPLKVGEIGMSQHDPRTSPFGWHIVKRLR